MQNCLFSGDFLTTGHMQSHVPLLSTTKQDMHMQGDIYAHMPLYGCTESSHLTITQHTAGSFLLSAASKLDGLPYIFSYADGHITGAGIPLK